MKNKLIVIEGPTGVGKTAYAIDLALQYNTEIISADSRQFYKELTIGVARPSLDELAAVPHHFIAHISIHQYYSVSIFEQEVLAKLQELFEKHPIVIMVGGSGLYVNAVCKGIDDLPDPSPELRADLKLLYETEGLEALQKMTRELDPVYSLEVDMNNPKRLLRALEVCKCSGLPFSSLRTKNQKKRNFEIERFAVNRPKDLLYDRINQRVDIMLEQGLEQEVQSLVNFQDLNALHTVGYKELFAHYKGEISFEQAITDIKTHSRRYAKRQLTWLRAQENIQWIDL